MASRRELAPLLQQEEGLEDQDDFDDSGFSEMEDLQATPFNSKVVSGAASPRAMHVAAFTVSALGTIVVLAIIFFLSSGSPLRARVEASMRLADGACISPEGYCRGAQSYFSWEDCDADGIPDPSCLDIDGYCTCIGSANKCLQGPVPCLHGAVMCERPHGWCGDPELGFVRSDPFVYSTQDCDGDNEPDPFCQKADSNTGEFSCGCLQSSKDCLDTPMQCPGKDVAPVQMLSAKKTEVVALKSAYSGTLMIINVMTDDRVTIGDEIFAVLDKEAVRYMKSPINGVVTKVLPVHTGDHVTAGQLLIMVHANKTKLKSTSAQAFRWPAPVPMPAPAPVVNSSKPFPGLPFLIGFDGNPILATGFKGVNWFDGWGFKNFKVGDFLPGGTKFAYLHGLDGPVEIKMPEDGVITGLQPLHQWSEVNAGGQLAFYTNAIDGVKLPSGQGFEVIQNPAVGAFKRWKVMKGERIHYGDEVADFVGLNGKLTTVEWHGDNGVVFEQQFLPPLTAVKADADLITVGAGVFDGYRVKVGDFVKKGNTICVLEIGGSMVVPAHKDQLIVALPIKSSGVRVGFGQPLAVVTVVKEDGTKGAILNVTAAAAWVVTSMISDKDTVPVWIPFFYLIAVGSLAFWVMRRKLLACFASIWSLVTTGSLKPPPMPRLDDILSEATPGPPPPRELVPIKVPGRLDMSLAVVQPQPAPAAEPTPAPAPAPAQSPVQLPATATVSDPSLTPVYVEAPPLRVPIYFDNRPYYFKYRPLGIKFSRTKAPIMIENFTFNSYGRTLGLTVGQRLTRINDFDVPVDYKYGQVEEVLTDALEDLPDWPLRIDFRTPDAVDKSFYFTARPLGILFTKQLPIKVEQFRPHSLAQRTGVMAGWEIVRIADKDTSQAGMAAIGIKGSHAGYKHVDKQLLEGLAPLPPWKVRIDFKTQKGKFQSFEFGEKPLGILFTKVPPIKIELLRPGSRAFEMGVRAGWEIVQIGDDPVGAEDDEQRVDKLLHSYLQHLPTRKRSRSRSP